MVMEVPNYPLLRVRSHFSPLSISSPHTGYWGRIYSALCRLARTPVHHCATSHTQVESPQTHAPRVTWCNLVLTLRPDLAP
jgi:hypothetical protein